MPDDEWVRGPFGLEAARGRTCVCERTVLVVVHTVTAGTRLADVVPLVEPDPRVQVVFTCAPSALVRGGVRGFLERLGGVVVPWQQAAQVRFDLAVAASYGLLEQLHAPVLTVPHGAGYGKYLSRWDGPGPRARREVAGPERARLTCHGRVVPAAIAVPTRRQLARLRRSCPEAAPVAVVAGDPCYDRLAVSLRSREAYRSALGVTGRKLVAVSSTWGPGSLRQRCPDLLPRLLDELPAGQYAVAAILHPAIWYWHGPRQVLAWHADCVRRGLILVPPEEGWRAVLASADALIGDHGSVSYYAASAGVPVLLGAFPASEVAPDCPAAEFGRSAPRLHLGRPFAPQLRRAGLACPPERAAEIRAQITDVPGQSARIIRSVMYRLMNLAEPPEAPPVRPVPAAQPVAIPETFGAAR